MNLDLEMAFLTRMLLINCPMPNAVPHCFQLFFYTKCGVFKESY